jgi:hypothetical protein
MGAFVRVVAAVRHCVAFARRAIVVIVSIVPERRIIQCSGIGDLGKKFWRVWVRDAGLAGRGLSTMGSVKIEGVCGSYPSGKDNGVARVGHSHSFQPRSQNRDLGHPYFSLPGQA